MPNPLNKGREREMTTADKLEALLTTAEGLGLDVRAEFMGGDGGGLCHLKGQRILFVDTSADVVTRYERTLEAVADLPELDECYLIPELRRDIEDQKSMGHSS